MKLERYEIPLMQESIYHCRLKDGLNVFIMPRQGYTKMHAMFATKYGSIDSDFVTPEGKQLSIPDGTAHFLEHKLFDNKDGNVFEKFSKYGASANAFTSATTTAYIFTATNYIYENLKTLIEFVQQPYFTPESIQKEQGIIGQEINIGDDDPGWQVYFNLLKNMYHNHPVRRDIAGTVESIAKIDKDVLYDAYNTFYHPSNMVLFVTGNIEIKKAFDCIGQSLKEYNDKPPIKRIYPSEPQDIVSPYIEAKYAISLPLFIIGYKDNTKVEGDELLKKDIEMQILTEMIFSKRGDLYDRLINEGLINESFSAGYMGHSSFSFSYVEGESKDPKAVSEIIFDYTNGFSMDEQNFNIAKKVVWGRYVESFNSPENYTRQFVSNFLMGANYGKFYELFEKIMPADINNRLNLLDRSKAVLSAVLPLD